MQDGEFVNLYVIDPIEKIWGRLVRLSEAGVVVRGIDVRQIENFRYQFKKDEVMVYPQTTFYPMRRVQKMDLDEPMEEALPSTIDSLKEFTGLSSDQILPSPKPAL